MEEDSWGGVGSWLQYGAVSAAFLYGARTLYNFYNAPEEQGGFAYLPWPGSVLPSHGGALPERPLLLAAPGGGATADAASGGGGGGGSDGPVTADDVVVVDCTHPSLPTLTHHKEDNNPPGVSPADTSTGIVLNALTTRSWKLDLPETLSRRCVTTNHFDVDALLSVWAYTNRRAALEHEAVLRHMARIGDFREAFLSPDLITAHGAHDSITFIRAAYTALKLVCWINTLERRTFSAPYEQQGDCDAKMAFFLPRFEAVLNDPESAWGDWQAEYTRVVSGFDLLAGADCMVEVPPGLGLAVLTAPEPLHYVSLFSHTIGCDVVLMMYEHNRYEVECKYTQFVALVSRPVWPRLDMAPLAAVLNTLEARYSSQQQGQQQQGQQYGLYRSSSGGSTSPALQQYQQQYQGGGASSGGGAQQQGQQAQGQQQAGGLRWVANSLTDTGPLLRLQAPGEALTKAQRYGQPYERTIHSSAIPPHKMQAIVQSFLGFGLQGLQPRVGGWEWRELQELNAAIHWQDWASCIIQQASRGELLDTAAAAAASSSGGAGVPPPPATPRRPPLHPEVWQQQQQQQQPQQQPQPQQRRQPSLEMQPLVSPASTAGGSAVSPAPGSLLSAGVPLPASEAPVVLSQPSMVAAPEALAALAAALPPLHRGNPWLLLYSTARDGISLATLMRKAEKVAPSLLLVRDGGGGVFGAFVTDAWRYNPRFYGTGESFVFQLEPRRLLWPWVNAAGLRNDFFQYASHDLLGVGGSGHWALSLDGDLLRGSSGGCDTFGSPCLASREEFEVMAVELWHVH